MSLLNNENVVSILKGEFELSVLKSAYSRINDYNDPLRGPVFALLMRELIRIAMDRIAPDDQVRAASWCSGEPWLYKKGKKGKQELTRTSRYRFAITGTISNEKLLRYPELDCSDAIGDLKDLVFKLSKFAHISPGTYDLSPDDSMDFLKEVETIVVDYAEKLVATKKKVGEIMLTLVDAKLNEHILEAIPQELDELSSGTLVNALSVESLQDFDTSSASPVLSGCGVAEIELNYGGGKDGYSSDDSYPLEFYVQVDPDTFDIAVQSISVDTSSFYE